MSSWRPGRTLSGLRRVYGVDPREQHRRVRGYRGAGLREPPARAVLNGLRLDAQGAVKPLLATWWEIAPDGLTYTFHLRDGVKFQDGTPFDASIVKFNLERAIAPGSTNVQKQALSVIRQVEVVDPRTVRLHLSAPYSDLLYTLAWGDSVMVSPKSVATLATAPVVVGGGRGVGSAEAFGPLEELADLLGGVVGCSRAVTNNGWRPHSDQVGQTGTRIAPEIYIASGISGAIQHWVGAMAAKNILAINTDSEANMVARAGHAVIGDLHQVIPAIIEEIRRRRG